MPPPLATVNIPFASMSPNSNIANTPRAIGRESVAIIVWMMTVFNSRDHPLETPCKGYGFKDFASLSNRKVVLKNEEILGWLPEFADEFDDDDESEEGSKGDTANSHGFTPNEGSHQEDIGRSVNDVTSPLKSWRKNKNEQERINN
ncbi:hypothetical protein Tco_0657311 [Tanacetum coccineum]|uniref:Uncharacterized protein n=1 Tax=Tanacetum coccineum TaxID=301880 RepID=A0ABQ4XBT6_9ASTR